MNAERDWPVGHPKSSDYDPASPEAKAWREANVHPAGERDWPKGNPKAADTPGESVIWQAGVDPAHPELEPFSGHKVAVPADAPAADLLKQFVDAGAQMAGTKPPTP